MIKLSIRDKYEIGDIITLPLEDILTSNKSYFNSRTDNLSGRGSKSFGPVKVWITEDNRFLLIDGQHRFAEFVYNQEPNIQVEIMGIGYSDTYAIPSLDNTFDCNKEKNYLKEVDD